MSTLRAVPRYPEVDQSYAEWLAAGPKSVSGVIDIVNNAGSHGYIQPDQFPEQRIFFSYKKWPFELRDSPLVGRRVVFHVPPQDYSPGTKAQAFDVKLV